MSALCFPCLTSRASRTSPPPPSRAQPPTRSAEEPAQVPASSDLRAASTQANGARQPRSALRRPPADDDGSRAAAHPPRGPVRFHDHVVSAIFDESGFTSWSVVPCAGEPVAGRRRGAALADSNKYVDSEDRRLHPKDAKAALARRKSIERGERRSSDDELEEAREEPVPAAPMARESLRQPGAPDDKQAPAARPDTLDTASSRSAPCE